ncbi:unnamed protein product [Lymnaea stagnalis]|uniref:Ankyrin repeat protein n=1 Tax=Lymnaea stagnalis TaxID=6523 RepID=A0AAV2H7Z5_LYMST
MRPRTSHSLRGPACSLCDVIRFGYFHQIRLLVSTGIDLESRDDSRRTPIMLCAFMQPESWGASTALTLIEHGADVGKTDCWGRNVLHYACIFERTSLVRILLKAIDYDLNGADKWGNTALHYAAMSGNLTVTKSIAQSLKRYRISPNARNDQGKTPFDEATQAGNDACAHVIQQEQAGRRPGSEVMKDVRFADSAVNLEKSETLRTWNVPLVKQGRITRPKSAVFITGRESGSSFDSVDGGRFTSDGRTSLFHSRSKNPLYAKGHKNDDDIIFCASEKDFRNKPDYVFKLVHMSYDPDRGDPVYSTSHNPGWTDQSQRLAGHDDWRCQLNVLFEVYGHQCTPSWRSTKTPEIPTDIPESTTPVILEEVDGEEKGRGRRQSVVSRNSISNDSKRRQSAARLRKMAANFGSQTPR